MPVVGAHRQLVKGEQELAALHKSLVDSSAAVKQPPTDEAFGRQMKLRAPGGMLVKVNELEPESYR